MTTHRTIHRDLAHAQLRLASTDDQALDDAIRYVVRALVGLYELRGAADLDRVAERMDRVAKGRA